MEFTVRCIEDYITDDDELIFKEGDHYTLFIDEDSEAKVMYSKDEGTLFLSGSLKRHFEKY